VAIEAFDRDGVVGRNGVDEFFSGKWGSGPILVIPIAAQNPTSRSDFAGVGIYATAEFGLRFGAAEVDGEQLEAAVDEVGVAVDEAGECEFAVKVDGAGGGIA